jgi:hypothetical protein
MLTLVKTQWYFSLVDESWRQAPWLGISAPSKITVASEHVIKTSPRLTLLTIRTNET